MRNSICNFNFCPTLCSQFNTYSIRSDHSPTFFNQLSLNVSLLFAQWPLWIVVPAQTPKLFLAPRFVSLWWSHLQPVNSIRRNVHNPPYNHCKAFVCLTTLARYGEVIYIWPTERWYAWCFDILFDTAIDLHFNSQTRLDAKFLQGSSRSQPD